MHYRFGDERRAVNVRRHPSRVGIMGKNFVVEEKGDTGSGTGGTVGQTLAESGDGSGRSLAKSGSRRTTLTLLQQAGAGVERTRLLRAPPGRFVGAAL